MQCKVEGRDWSTIDAKRTAVFSTFGFLFLGCWQYTLFVKIFPRVFPNVERFAAAPLRDKLRDAAGLRAVAGQVAIENLGNNCILYFSCFYTVQTLYDGGAPLDGLRKFRRNFAEDVPSILALWVPVQTVNFAFSPLWLRVPVTTAASFFWTSFVSFSRGNNG